MEVVLIQVSMLIVGSKEKSNNEIMKYRGIILLYRTKSVGPFILTMKTLMQKLGLMNTTFNKFLIISKKNIGFLLKFYHGFSKQYHIFELRDLFTTFESLKSVKFPRHTVVQNSNSKNFHSNSSSFQITL